MAKRVRLADIAARLNITKVSVSKALRDHPDISKDTRALVKKTAHEMGYSPNLLARSLSSQKSHTIGVVVPKIAHTFFASVIEAVQEEATEEGYGIVLAVSNENALLERQHIERLLAMRVDGLLVSVSQEAPRVEVYRKVHQMKVPLVFFDRRLDGLPFSSVTVNDREGARLAVAHLLEQGFRDIAHVAGSQETQIGRERRQGYAEALAAFGLAEDPTWVVAGGFDERYGYDACCRILDAGRIPEVFFAVTFPVSLGIRAALQDHDPALLEQVQIISFGDGGFDEFSIFPHYCVRQPTQEMGRSAMRLLLAEIEALEEEGHLTAEPVHQVLPTAIVPPPARYAALSGMPRPHNAE